MNPLFALLFFSLGGGEIFLIILVLLVVFGPSKIPEIARQLGKGINEIKKASSDIAQELKNEVANVEKGIGEEPNLIKKEVEKDVAPVNSNESIPEALKESEEIPDVYQSTEPIPENNKKSPRQPIL